MANYGSGFVSGAGAGAMAGSSLGPYGALAGGVLGGLAGLFGAYEQEKDAKKKQEILDEITAVVEENQVDIDKALLAYYGDENGKNDNFIGQKGDIDTYRTAISGYDPNAFVGDFEEFKYTDKNGKEKTVDDFLNPYMDKIIGDTTKQISHSAAGAGIGRGTGAANAIATGVAQKENELYNTALNAYNTDRSQSYSEWAGNIDRMQQRLNALKSATDTQLNMKGNLAQDYANRKQNEIADTIAAKQANTNSNLQLASMGLMI